MSDQVEHTLLQMVESGGLFLSVAHRLIDAHNAEIAQAVKAKRKALEEIVDVGTGIRFDVGSVNFLLDKIMQCKEIAIKALEEK